jgi:putative ABC transport system substrate-binding protein
MARIAYVVPSAAECAPTHASEAFHQSLKDYGYVSGQNVVWDRRCFQNDNQVTELIAELVRQVPDVIVVAGARAARAAKAATATIPIVFVGVGDPIGIGLVNSLSKPDRNITGITNIEVALTQKRLALLKEAVPGINRVAVLLDPGLGASSAAQWREADEAARVLQLNLVRLEASSAKEIEGVLRALPRDATAIFVAGSQTLSAEYVRIARLTLERRLPAMMYHAVHARAGCLLSYGQSDVDLLRLAGNYVGKILKGAKPSELPVEQPTRLDLAINMRTARALGITIPNALLARADEIIQ